MSLYFLSSKGELYLRHFHASYMALFLPWIAETFVEVVSFNRVFIQ